MKKLLILILISAVLSAISAAKKDKIKKNSESVKVSVTENSGMPESSDIIGVSQNPQMESEIKERNPKSTDDNPEFVDYKSEIDSLKKERDFFKTYYIREIRKNLASDQQYLGGSFSELDAGRISEIVDRYSPCSDEVEFAGIIESAAMALTNKRAFETARHLMAEDGPDYTPGLPSEVNRILAEIRGPLSKIQKGEIEALRKIAEDYPKAVRSFRSRIESIREEKLDRQAAATDKGYAASIQSDDLPPYLSSNEVRNEYRYRISLVPKLKAMYDEWMKLLTKNFMDPRTVEIEEAVLRLEVGNEQNNEQ